MYILAVILYGLGGIIAFHSTCTTFELRSKVLPFESAKNILLFTRLIVLCRFAAKVGVGSEKKAKNFVFCFAFRSPCTTFASKQ